jgi:hypothetical protein
MEKKTIVTQTIFITFFDVISTGDFCMFQKWKIGKCSNEMWSRARFYSLLILKGSKHYCAIYLKCYMFSRLLVKWCCTIIPGYYCSRAGPINSAHQSDWVSCTNRISIVSINYLGGVRSHYWRKKNKLIWWQNSYERL